MANIKPLILSGGKTKQLGSIDTVATNNLGSGAASSSNFLRGDQTWASPTASVAIIETEIDFGATPVSEASFTITDAGINSGMKILCSVSYAIPTGKDQDELEMDDLQLRAVAGTGNFTLYVRAADGSYLADKFRINYLAS